MIQRIEQIRFARKSRWLGAYWIFEVQLMSNEIGWVRETAEEGTYEEIEVQPSEEPIETVSGTTGPIP